jgi:hypothetical protein
MKISGSIEFTAEIDLGAVHALITVYYEGMAITGEDHMAYTLPNDKTVDVAVTYADAHGNEVNLPQGNVSWTSSDETIVTVAVNATDDQLCSVQPVGPVGNVQINCTGKNTDGSDIIALMDITVVAGAAVTGTIAPVQVAPA